VLLKLPNMGRSEKRPGWAMPRRFQNSRQEAADRTARNAIGVGDRAGTSPTSGANSSVSAPELSSFGRSSASGSSSDGAD